MRDLHVLTHSFPTTRSSDLVCYKRHISCTLRRCLLLMCSHGAVNHADSGAHPIDLRSRVVSQHRLRSDGASQWDDITYHLYACSTCFVRSEEHTSELQSLMRISYAVFVLKKTIQVTK